LKTPNLIGKNPFLFFPFNDRNQKASGILPIFVYHANILYMKEITFKEVKDGLINWNKIAKDLDQTELLFQYPIRFEVLDDIYDELEKEEALTVYFGYKKQSINQATDFKEIISDFFAIIIPKSLDLEENYRGDILPKETRYFPAIFLQLGSTEISSEDAYERIDNWNNAEKRKNIKTKVESSPLIFEIPKINISSKVSMNYLFLGLIHKDEDLLHYDFVVEQKADDKENSSSFYDTARPVPPFKPKVHNGLYKFLGLERE